MLVLVGLLKQAAENGFCSVTTVFLCFVAGVFVLSAFLHPQVVGLPKCTIWGASSEKVPSSMRKIRKFKSFCACAKSHMGLCSPLIYSVVMILLRDSENCADLEADQGPRYPHMPKDKFSHRAVHIYPVYSDRQAWTNTVNLDQMP